MYVDWIGLAQDRDRWRTLVSVVMNLRVPQNAGNFLTSCKPVSFSRRTLHHGVSKYDLRLPYEARIYTSSQMRSRVETDDIVTQFLMIDALQCTLCTCLVSLVRFPLETCIYCRMAALPSRRHACTPLTKSGVASAQTHLHQSQAYACETTQSDALLRHINVPEQSAIIASSAYPLCATQALGMN